MWEASTTTISASMPFMASVTDASMNSPSLVRGRLTPGVSTRTICHWSPFITPIRRERVVWGLLLTMEIFSPTRRLIRVDLPTLGEPTMAVKPE